MYKILKKDDYTLLGLIEQPNFIKLQKNGCFNLTDEENAQGIVIDNQIYQLCGKNKLKGNYPKAKIIKIDNGEILASINEIQGNMDELLIDQEYRLTLLELGVTE